MTGACTFLLEICTEEIPANALAGARRQLHSGMQQHLQEAGYTGFTIRALSTCRRLVVIINGLPPRQADRQEQVTGPPKRVAFNDDGTPGKAAVGFSRKVGVPVEQLQILSTAKGEYLAATVVHTGRATAQILAEAVTSVVGAMRFPKMMRWGTGEQLFVRPVHSVVALLDDEVVPLELFGIRSGRTTSGHRVHQPELFTLARAGDYLEELRRHDVLVEPEERHRQLERLASTLVAEVGCRVHTDDALVAEHVELVELPGMVLGEIDAKYLKLPDEVVIKTLRHHQKCLVLERPDGTLAPYFLAVVDRRDDPQGLVRRGNEWVIGARLADAGFFFAEDRKRPLAELVPGLQRLELHRTLGSVAGKCTRVAELALKLAAELGEPRQLDEIKQAAGLVKADLLSHMVGEFPELQGVMGGHYLRLEGAAEELWTAARDHYRPQGFEGGIPASQLGCLLGAADRLDTVAGLFGVGEIPSGSKDPFGLRRAAQGLVRIVVDKQWRIDLTQVVHDAVTLHRDHLELEVETVTAEVTRFLGDRVRRFLTDLQGLAGDTADAVMAAGWGVVPELLARAEALERVRNEPSFRSLALAFKRVKNITEGQTQTGIDPSLLAEPEERELHEHAQAFHERIEPLLRQRQLDEAFSSMATLAEVLDRFFDKVLVMSEDTTIRSNRIALLRSLGNDFLLLADLSKLQVEGGAQ